MALLVLPWSISSLGLSLQCSGVCVEVCECVCVWGGGGGGGFEDL